ncbi:MAG TPA: DUF924 family protein [Paracoccaceae bacterium]|nr:DUF924 family protein [Paracoccaceae bacterium]
MHREAEKVIEVWQTQIGGPLFNTTEIENIQPLNDAMFDLWKQAFAGGLEEWQSRPRTMLALMILLDQYPRTMYRNQEERQASDRMAIALAKKAIKFGMDMKLAPEERQFFYVPLMHSENQVDQDHCVRLCMTREAEAGALHHAKARRNVIRQFGRFPHRNTRLGRQCTPQEEAYLSEGGFPAVLANISVDSGSR